MKEELINYFTCVHPKTRDEAMDYTEDGMICYDLELWAILNLVDGDVDLSVQDKLLNGNSLSQFGRQVCQPPSGPVDNQTWYVHSDGPGKQIATFVKQIPDNFTIRSRKVIVVQLVDKYLTSME